MIRCEFKRGELSLFRNCVTRCDEMLTFSLGGVQNLVISKLFLPFTCIVLVFPVGKTSNGFIQGCSLRNHAEALAKEVVTKVLASKDKKGKEVKKEKAGMGSGGQLMAISYLESWVIFPPSCWISSRISSQINCEWVGLHIWKSLVSKH